MGHFPTPNANKFILVPVDYVFKWVEVSALPTNDARVVIRFIRKNIFIRFGVPRKIISDCGKRFCNSQLTLYLPNMVCYIM